MSNRIGSMALFFSLRETIFFTQRDEEAATQSAMKRLLRKF